MIPDICIIIILYINSFIDLFSSHLKSRHDMYCLEGINKNPIKIIDFDFGGIFVNDFSSVKLCKIAKYIVIKYIHDQNNYLPTNYILSRY